MTRIFASIILAAAAIGTGGCVATAPVKQVVADPDAYLQEFARVQPAVADKVPKETAKVAFKRIVVDAKSTETGSEEQVSTRDVTSTWVFVNGDGGLVHSYATVKNNDVPFRINYRLSYLGVKALKWQTVFLNRPNAEPATEVWAVKQFDPLMGSSNGVSDFQYTYATGEHGLRNDGRDTCRFGATKAASELHAAFSGQYTEVNCETYGGNGQMVSRGTYAYLSHYGVGIPIEHANSKVRTVFKFTNARVE